MMRVVDRVWVVIALLFAGLELCLAGVIRVDLARSGTASISVLSESAREITLEYSCGEIVADSVTIDGRIFTRSGISGGVSTSLVGWPELPVKTALLQVSGEPVSIEILDADSHVVHLAPAQPVAIPQLRSGQYNDVRAASPEFYGVSRRYPEQPATITTSGIAGGTRVLILSVCAASVLGESENWTIYSRVRLRIRFSPPALDQSEHEQRALSTYVERLTINPDDPGNDTPPLGPRLILATEREFLPALDPWLQWKLASGIPILTVIYSESATSAEGLRARLRAITDSLQFPPEYLFIVGDADRVPMFFGVGGSLSDHPYSDLGGGDYLPDWSVGRLPCSNVAGCAAWVERSVNYERFGVLTTEPRATVFSSAAALDPHHGIDMTNLFSGVGLSVSSLQEPQSSTLSQLVSSLSNSPSWVFYIGHGHAEAWSSVQPHYTSEESESISAQHPANIVSVACATADLDYPAGSIAESWLNSSDPFAPLSYFGATESTAFFYSDTLGISMLRAIFTEHVERLGQAADYGRLVTALCFPQSSGGLTEETIQQFCLLGDPSMRVHTRSPDDLRVSVPVSILLGTRSLEFTVTQGNSPENGAEICLASQSLNYYAVRRTGPTGQAVFELNIAEPAELQWTATAQNATAEQGTIYVVPASGPYIIVAGCSVGDDEGDSDGRLDRGEPGGFQVTLANIGSQISSAGELFARSSSSLLEVTNTSRAIRAILPHDSLTASMNSVFTVSESAPDGEHALVDFLMVSLSDTQLIGTRSFELHAPILGLATVQIAEDSGDGDRNPESGERLRLALSFLNSGGDAARQVCVSISTSTAGFAFLTSIDSTAALVEGETFAATFLCRASADLPRGLTADFEYQVTSSNHALLIGNAEANIGRVPAYLYVLDRSPENVDAVANALSSLGVEYERGTQLPEDLFRYSSIWIFSGIFPNQSSLPHAQAVRIANYLETGGSCYWEGGDVWAFDASTPLHDLFHIHGEQDGTSDAGPVSGEYGTMYDVYEFEYGGENSFIDQMSPLAGAQVFLRNSRPGHEYPAMIAYADPRYRTVGSSIELGGLIDAEYPSTRVRMLSDILAWLRLSVRFDLFPPEIDHTPISVSPPPHRPIQISADIQDASGIASALVEYRINELWQSVALESVAGRYRALLPGAESGAEVSYRIVAIDSSTGANRAQTDEFHFEIGDGEENVAFDMDLGDVPRADAAMGISASDGTGWCITRYADGQSCLELSGNGKQKISYTTEIFGAGLLRGAEIRLWNYLRMAEGETAAIRGSVDGGRTFPFAVWTSVSSSAGELSEGWLQLTDQKWMCGQDSVALQFEYTGSWYWRIGRMRVVGETHPKTIPARQLVIHPRENRISLYWDRVPNALYYVVRGTDSDAPDAEYLPIAVVKDTSYFDAEATYFSTRFYVVDAVISETLIPPLLHESDRLRGATLRPLDILWNEKRAQHSHNSR